MEREEIIQSLRRCATKKNGDCEENCPRYAFKENTGIFTSECESGLMFRAADMLEADEKPEKTADEMFRELGYVRDTKHNKHGPIIYVKDSLSITIDYDGYCTVADDGETIGIEPAENRAVCKLLDKMGVE